MRIGFLFGGQGPDLPRLGPDLSGVGERTGRLLELAADLLGMGVPDLWARGGRVLERTEAYQPVLVALQLGLHHALAEYGVCPFAVVGHSLGELSAWAAAGGVAAEDAVRIAAERGRLMAERGARAPGGLLALGGAPEQSFDRVQEVALEYGGVYVAALNAPTEWVIGGSDLALRAVSRRFPCTRLPVEGPWHGPPMAPVLEEFRKRLRTFETRPLTTVLVSSRSGGVAAGAEMRDLVAEQLIHPVCWTAALATLVDLEVDALVTVGPGRVMRGLVHRNGLRNLPLHSTDTPAMITRTIGELSR